MQTTFTRAEKYRVKDHPKFKTKTGDGFGLFIIENPAFRIRFIVDDGRETGWEHVRVSCKIQNENGEIKNLTPPWETMQMAKMMFWDDEECVLQLHPPRSVYVNSNEHVLHLWKQVGINHPTPPQCLV